MSTCASCGRTWGGYKMFCPQCENNELLRKQNELIERNQRNNSIDQSVSSRPYKSNPIGDIIAYIFVFGFLIIPPVFFPETGLGKFLIIFWKIATWPFLLLYEIIRR